MAYCVKCGAKVEDGVRFCPQCGAEIPVTGYTGQAGSQDDTYFNPEDVKKNKGMGVLSYIGILVLIPLLAGDKRSEYVRFHSNQGLVLFLVSTVVDLLDGEWVLGFHSWLNFGNSIFSTALDILSFACFILMIVGIVSACKGEKKEFPVIGRIKLVKSHF